MITMAEHMSLLEFLRELLTNEQARDWYAQDPDAALKYYGLDDLSPADVRDALVLLEDNQTANFDRDYNTGWDGPSHSGRHDDDNDRDHGRDNDRDDDRDHGGRDHDDDHGGDDHRAAVETINRYITNNFVNDRDTIVDNSTNQQIDTHGGDFDQDIDVDSVVASGDGAVAAGGDIRDSNIVSGDDNQVGDGNVRGNDNVVGDDNNVVSGDDNTTAFGDGDANNASFEDVEVGGGGAISVGGNASGSYDVDDSFNESEETTTNNTHFEDSFNQDNDSTENSHNDTDTDIDTDSHNESVSHVGSHNTVDIDD
jgi:hypothetical protein